MAGPFQMAGNGEIELHAGSGLKITRTLALGSGPGVWEAYLEAVHPDAPAPVSEGPGTFGELERLVAKRPPSRLKR